jgi:tetratricopeptide (TPR) repeat protein
MIAIRLLLPRRFLTVVFIGKLFVLCSDRQVLANPNANTNYSQAIPSHLLTSSHIEAIDQTAILDQSWRMIEKLEDSHLKVTLLNQLAISYAKLDNPDQAFAILGRSLSIAQSFDDITFHVTALTDIAKYYAQIGHQQEAIKILDRSVQIARSVKDKQQQGQLLLHLSFSYRAIGDNTKPDTLLSQSQAIISSADSPDTEYPFSDTTSIVKLGFSGWVRSFRETKALVGIDFDLYQQWKRDDVFIDASIFADYNSSRSINTFRPGSLTFTFYRHHLSQRWSLFADLFGATNQSLLSSRTDDEDLTLIAEGYAGLGYNLWRGDSPRNFLDLQLGVGPRYEYDFVDLDQKRNELNPALAIILWGRGISLGKAHIDTILSLNPTLNRFSNYDIVSDTQLSVPLGRKWSLSNRLFLRYRNELIFEQNPKLLFFFTTGLKYEL